MNRRRLTVVTAALAMAGFFGCVKEPKTELVRSLEAAGAGDMRTASTEAIEQWLRQHNQIAEEVDRTCRPLREKAPASWTDTTDGRICGAAARVTFFDYKNRIPDGATFSFHKEKK